MWKFVIFLALFAGASCHFRPNPVILPDFRDQLRVNYPFGGNLVLARSLTTNRIIGQMPDGSRTRSAAMKDASIDLNLSKIPSLMDPSKSVGLLQPSDINLSDQCFAEPQCDPSSRFRSMDGSCNNLRFPVWGRSNTPNTRIIQADYADGVKQPRKSLSGGELPNVRRIRTNIFGDVDQPSPDHNLFVMQFGQTIAHDTQLAVNKRADNGAPLQCCNPDGSMPESLPDRCLPIFTPLDDPDSKNRCFSLAKNVDTSDLGCWITPVRHNNEVTSFVDASMLYGSDDKTASSLRTFTDGKLKGQLGPNEKLYLPNADNPKQFCNLAKENTVCYVTGDVRVNIQPDMAVQTISMLRLHNFICDELHDINPSWNDERLYQEARKLLIGMYQHVTYNEYVPIILGKDYARVNHLLPLSNGFNGDYDESLNPSTFASFAAAAFRSLHSYIQGNVNLVNEARQVTSEIRLSDYFLRPEMVQVNDNYDSLTRGLLTQSAQAQDQFFTTEISNFMFRVSNRTDGVDLISLDLARGREHGIPPYNKFRQLCGLSKAKTFDDLADQISRKNIDALAGLYEHVDDVDFYAAGFLEKAKPGSIFGHTFQCIIGEMFWRWKIGDRYFYEVGDQPGSFNTDQLAEIRKTTLALIVCLTTDIQFVQRNAFELPSEDNPLVPCSSILKLNLAAWKEE